MSRRTSFPARTPAMAIAPALSLCACSGRDDESPERGPGTHFSLLVESVLTTRDARTEAVTLLKDTGLELMGKEPTPVALSGNDGDLFALPTTGEAKDRSVLSYDLDVR